MFVATLYTSDSDKIMRYTDEVSIVFVGGSRTPEVHLLTECCSHRLLSTHLSFFFSLGVSCFAFGTDRARPRNCASGLST